MSAGIARALYTRALVASEPNRDDLYTSRSWALQCLAQRPGVAGRLAQTGGRITRWVVAIVPPEDARCLAWGAIAWSEWLYQRGVVGAALDLDSVETLGQRAVELAPDLDRGLSHLALGLSLGIRPAVLGRDADAAGAALNLARQQASDRLIAAVAMAELVYGPAGDATAWRRTLTAVADARASTQGLGALEDAGARRRARELLSAGFPQPSRW
ncbi:MAG: hypothetical protein GXP62_19295 [Oligoflexia bacterium]|nr:hypothetical protein [Oligoflexia bacterium]